MGNAVSSMEEFAHRTHLDEVVHKFTGGKRLLNEDGSYNPELLTAAWGDIITITENIADTTGMSNYVANFTGGKRVFNKDGTYNPELEETIHYQLQRWSKFINKEVQKELVDWSHQMAIKIFEHAEEAVDILKNAALSSADKGLFMSLINRRYTPKDEPKVEKAAKINVDREQTYGQKLIHLLGIDRMGEKQALMFAIEKGVKGAFGLTFTGGGGVMTSISHSNNVKGIKNLSQSIEHKIEVETGLYLNASVGVGIGAAALNKDGIKYFLLSDVESAAGYGVAVQIDAAAVIGLALEFGFNWDKEKKGFYLNSIQVALSEGVGGIVNVAATHTVILAMTKLTIDLNPPEDGNHVSSYVEVAGQTIHKTKKKKKKKKKKKEKRQSTPQFFGPPPGNRDSV